MKKGWLFLFLLLLPFAANAAGIGYLDADGTEKTYTGTATAVTGSNTAWTAGWYYAAGTVEIAERVTVTGDVHLVLEDGAVLTAEKGITVMGANKLTVYAQSNSYEQMGRLNANTNLADTGTGIGVPFGASEDCGTVVLNGGRITANGGRGYYGSAGIGGRGGAIEINGGYIRAEGGSASYGAGAGIGGSGQSQSAGAITITNGVIIAKGGANGAAGIGGGGHDGRLNGPLRITGGWIEAKGNYRHGQQGQGQAIAIGGGASMQPADLSQSTMVLIDGTTKTGKVYGSAVLYQRAALEAGTVLTVPEGATLTIPQGGSLTVEQGAQIINRGTIYTDIALSGVENVYHLTHDPVYTAEGQKIRVACGNDVHLCHIGGELTLFAPMKQLTGDDKSAEAFLIGENWPEEAQEVMIGYEKLENGVYTPLTAAPTAAGQYRAYAAAGRVRAQVEYEIKAPVAPAPATPAPATPAPAPLPETGDAGSLLMLSAMLMLSMICMAAVLKKAGN